MESRVAGDMNKTIFNQHSKSSNEKNMVFFDRNMCKPAFTVGIDLTLRRHWKDGSDWSNYPTIAALLGELRYRVHCDICFPSCPQCPAKSFPREPGRHGRSTICRTISQENSFHFISCLAPCVPVMAPRRKILCNFQSSFGEKGV